MREPSWYSQPFPPEGAGLAEGIRNQLGRPEMDLLTILVRESAQNSWDARRRNRIGPVDYRIDMWTVGPAHAEAWRELLLRDAPLNEQLPLRESLTRASIRVMAVSDRGTTGLGGPTRADTAVTQDHDFVSFVRNIGEPRDTELGGGTYGFGKGIFYLISKPGTVLLHTRCETERGLETRLMGCALWKSYVATEIDGDRRYTGRHWWGDVSGEVVEPLIGAEADAMAHRLGLRPFKPDETGTSIVVIDPHLENLEPAGAAEYLADTIAWHLWPKMLDGPDEPPAMRFSVICDNTEYPVPDPRRTLPLKLFVSAYEEVRGADGTELECYRPRRVLGRLGLVKRPLPVWEPTRASQAAGIENVVHHVCLMRPAELVVTYHPGPKPPSEHLSYAGVFKADPAMDEIYAKAEPPTHDAWHPQSLEGRESTFVRTTFTRIKEKLDGLLDLGGLSRGGSAEIALGAASTMFSALVGGVWGTGGSTDYAGPGASQAPSTESMSAVNRDGAGHSSPDLNGPPTAEGTPHGHPDTRPSSGSGTAPPGGSVRRRPRVEYVRDPYLDERSGVPVVVQEFRLPSPGPQRVSGDLGVALSATGGRETDPPLGAMTPGLVGWEDAAGSLSTTPTYVVQGGDGAVWRAIVRPAPDTVTEIDITVEEVRAS